MSGRTLSAATEAKASAKHGAPGYLLEISFPSGVVRLCTMGERTWRGLTFLGWNFSVSGMTDAASGGTLTIADPNAAYRTLVLTDGLADQPVRIWQFYDGALGDGDPVEHFRGVAGAASWRRGQISTKLQRVNSRSTLSPRSLMSPETGYNFLAPKGTTFRWGDKQIELG